MAQARYIDQSAAFARAVEAALRERVPMSPRALQQAPFRVLVGANMPAVLVELGFLTNAEQEQQLARDDVQNALVQALVEGIVRYRAAASPRRQARSRPARGGARDADAAAASSPSARSPCSAVAGGLFVGLPRWYRPRRAPAPPRPNRGRGRRPPPRPEDHAPRSTTSPRTAWRWSPAQREVPFGATVVEQARAHRRAPAPPPRRPLVSAIPAETKLRDVYRHRARRRVRRSRARDRRPKHPGGSLDEIFTVYTIVNALTVNLPAMTRVQILVDGKEVDTLAGHVDLRHPLAKSLEWVGRRRVHMTRNDGRSPARCARRIITPGIPRCTPKARC